MNIGKTKNTFFLKTWFVLKLHVKIIYMTMKHSFFFLLWCKSEPILPIHRICKLRRAPCSQRGFILVSFLNLASGYENMNDHLF